MLFSRLVGVVPGWLIFIVFFLQMLEPEVMILVLQARYKQSLDPTVDEVKKLCTSLRRNAKEERVLFHYNGHGVPRPTVNGEIWVFNKVAPARPPLAGISRSCFLVQLRTLTWAFLCSRTTLSTSRCPFMTCRPGWAARPSLCTTAPTQASSSSLSSSLPCRESRSWR